jgi:hypothetical protein
MGLLLIFIFLSDFPPLPLGGVAGAGIQKENGKSMIIRYWPL